MNLSVDEMLRLARKVYPEKDAHIGPDGIEIYAPDKFRRHHDIFNPSLTGPPEQRLQALDCIVAAFALGTDACITRDAMQKYSFYAENWRGDIVILTDQCPDLLQAAISALLAGEVL